MTPWDAPHAGVSRLPIVGVMGSGCHGHATRAEPVGRWLGGEPVHLLTGGGGGVMETVSRAFTKVEGRRGISIGILPGEGGESFWRESWVAIHEPSPAFRAWETWC